LVTFQKSFVTFVLNAFADWTFPARREIA